MELTRIAPEGRQVIQAHREGGFTIAGVRHEGSVLVLPDRTLPWSMGELVRRDHGKPGADHGGGGDVDILILGAGAPLGNQGRICARCCRRTGIVIEAMDTRAACRTFNVLLAEDRRGRRRADRALSRQKIPAIARVRPATSSGAASSKSRLT